MDDDEKTGIRNSWLFQSLFGDNDKGKDTEDEKEESPADTWCDHD